MSKVLFITANPKPLEKSVSLGLGTEFLSSFKKENPKDEVVIIDLYNSNIPEIDSDLLYVIDKLKKGINPDSLSEAAQNKLARFNELTDQFVAADKYIFVTPLWNLGLPPRVKTYTDCVCVAGKTFRYTEKGPIGLLENKKCLHIHASGGFHSEDPYNHADPFLRDVMKFIGVIEYKTLLAEGHNSVPDKADNIINQAYNQIPELVKWFS